jgi:hypothetical protein
VLNERMALAGAARRWRGRYYWRLSGVICSALTRQALRRLSHQVARRSISRIQGSYLSTSKVDQGI